MGSHCRWMRVGADVQPGLCAGQYSVQDFAWNPGQDSIAIVQAGHDEGVDEGFNHQVGE